MSSCKTIPSGEMSVIVHGGAGSFTDEHGKLKIPYLNKALDAAWKALCNKKPGLVAVVEALRVLEGCEYCNAGYGSYPNEDGVVLLDVGLMRGNRDFLSLLNVRKVTYPSSVALDMFTPGKNLTTVWTHELMLELEAREEEKKKYYGVVREHKELISPFVAKLVKEGKNLEVEANPSDGGTVGCVVRDIYGEIAAGTSTGGINKKVNGRIGDTPLPGLGFFADSEICGYSVTGHGESIIRSQFPNLIMGRVREVLRENKNVFLDNPGKLCDIVNSEMQEMKRTATGKGGIILIPQIGQPAYSTISDKLSVGVRTGSCEKIIHSRAFILNNKGDELFEESSM